MLQRNAGYDTRHLCYNALAGLSAYVYIEYLDKIQIPVTKNAGQSQEIRSPTTKELKESTGFWCSLGSSKAMVKGAGRGTLRIKALTGIQLLNINQAVT